MRRPKRMNLWGEESFGNLLRALGLPEALLGDILVFATGQEQVYWRSDAHHPSQLQVVSAELILRAHPEWQAAVAEDPLLLSLKPAIERLLVSQVLDLPLDPGRPADWLVRHLATELGESALRDAWMQGDGKGIAALRQSFEPERESMPETQQGAKVHG